MQAARGVGALPWVFSATRVLDKLVVKSLGFFASVYAFVREWDNVVVVCGSQKTGAFM